MAVRRPLPTDAAIEPPRIRVTFQAACEPCEYAGPGRASSLTALEDFDAHVASSSHTLGIALAAQAAVAIIAFDQCEIAEHGEFFGGRCRNPVVDHDHLDDPANFPVCADCGEDLRP